MNDLIRWPLQFVRPMTQHEWQELQLREAHREKQRAARRRSRRQRLSYVQTRREQAAAPPL